MKKLRYKFVPLILIVFVVFGLFAASCVNNRLGTPQNVEIDLDNYTVSWDRVENARGYEIEVTSLEDGSVETLTVGSTKISCSLQTIPEGDYTVKVRATSGSSRNYSDSKWSKELTLNKDYYSGCTFSLINNGTEYEITGWTKPGDGTTDIIIPAEYRDKPVVGIAAGAFKSKSSLTSVVIEGNNLKYIGQNAFYSCTKLESISIPDSVTEIGEGAFHSCRVLTSIKIPVGVTEIADSTFLYCRKLADVDFGNVETIGDMAFMGCNEGLTELVLPDTVTSIGEKAFSSCSVLESIVLGTGVETISAYAFQNDTYLEKVEFKTQTDGTSSLEEIGEYAFTNCPVLSDITLPRGTKTIGTYAFYKDTALEDINIPTTVTKVGAYAFQSTPLYTNQSGSAIVYAGLSAAKSDADCKSWVIGYNEEVATNGGASSYNIVSSTSSDTITGITETLDSTVIGIADNAFYGASGIGRVDLDDNVQYIGDYAFYGSESIYQVNICGKGSFPLPVEIGAYSFARMTYLSVFRFMLPGMESGVTTVGDHAFYGDKVLKSVDIPESLTKIGAYAFRNTQIYTETGIDSANNVIYAGDGSTKWVVGYGDNYSSTIVTLDSQTRGIADYAFNGNKYMVTLEGLENVMYIGEGAFYRCTSLEVAPVIITATAIEDYAFYGCNSLTRLGAGASDYDHFYDLTSIGRSAFYGCSSLRTLDISYAEVRYIGKYAFYGCNSLSTLEFKDGLEEIDDYAFYKSGVETMVIPDSVERIGDKAFYKCPNLTSIDFGSGGVDMTIGDYAFYKCDALEEIDIPGRVKEIGDYAFYKCDAVTKLTIEEGVEKIGVGSFASLGITSLEIPSSVQEIGEYAFKSCKGLTSIIIPSSCAVIGENAFYGVDNATIYTDATDYLPQWSTRLNSSFRPFVWGCTLSSEDGLHVVSVDIWLGSVENVVRIEGNEETEIDTSSEENLEEGAEDEETRKGSVNFSQLCGGPEWEGHTFLGWALTPDGNPVLDADNIDLAYGEYGSVTLYAVWS